VAVAVGDSGDEGTVVTWGSGGSHGWWLEERNVDY